MTETFSAISDSLTESQVAKKVRDSANQIWLAGLGAYAKAEQEGSKLFDSLVKDGEKIESRTKGEVDRRLSAAKEKVEEVKSKAVSSWEKVEKAFDERVSRALSRLNIPSKADVDALVAQVDELAKVVRELSEAKTAARTAAKPAAKKSEKASKTDSK
ncbi:MAG TPA: phasin family protein [Pseudomonadales bacterium]|nr:phasin family protein [Pseudomonadales bacterium]